MIDKSEKYQTFESIIKSKAVRSSKEHSGTRTSELEISKLIPFSEHPFQLYKGKRLDDMVTSIKENGVMIPIIVRPKGEDTYEILSGHNRVNASKLAGLEKINALIKENVTEGQAKLIVTQTNFLQRSIEELLPSEKAKAFQMELDGLKEERKNQRYVKELENAEKAYESNGSGDSVPMEQKATSRDGVAKNNGISAADIQRYLRLNHLCQGLMKLTDEDTIPLRAAVYLSYIHRDLQEIICCIITENNFKLDIAKSEILRSYFESGKLSEETAYQILSGEPVKKKKPGKPVSIKLKQKLVSKYFSPEQKQTEIEEVIEKALTLYFEKLKETE